MVPHLLIPLSSVLAPWIIYRRRLSAGEKQSVPLPTGVYIGADAGSARVSAKESSGNRARHGDLLRLAVGVPNETKFI